jgi:phage terminase small subunit
MPKSRSPLNPREQAFVDAFFAKGRANATRSAVLAGYSARSAASQGSRMMRKRNIQNALLARQEAKRTAAILSAEERDKLLSRIAEREEIRDPKTAKSCVAELNKCDGRHSMTHHHKGRLTLEQVLEESHGS